MTQVNAPIKSRLKELEGERDYRCPNCGGTFRLGIPFVMLGFTGYQGVDHGCGPEFMGAVFIATDENRNKEFADIVNELTKERQP